MADAPDEPSEPSEPGEAEEGAAGGDGVDDPGSGALVTVAILVYVGVLIVATISELLDLGWFDWLILG